jgi:hypothetical protein
MILIISKIKILKTHNLNYLSANKYNTKIIKSQVF